MSENTVNEFEKNLENEKIVDVDINKRMKEAFIDYAMSVIISRALPDVRDGLKPVHRRILYAMYEEHLTADKPFFKSATTVGNVIGRYHPHGDASAYDALVRMAQDFSLRYPLVDGHGNFGSIDGDPPAAYRYTEARMSKIANELLADIDKDTVDFIPNFDEKRKEPVVLPTRIPTLLVNGVSGIAVGMATNIPSHNLREVINGAVALIDNPEITVDELMEHVKGPDFPTKASIMGRNGIRQAYETGRGRIIIRSKTEIVETKNDRFAIHITEIPYQVNKKELVKAIADLVKDKKVEGISDIRDLSSDRVGTKIVIDIKRDANPQVVLNHLFKYTRLQDSYSINMLAIVDGKPQVLGLKEILENYVKFQKEIVRRRINYDLGKALARQHILEGLKIALANIDEVIAVIRSAYDDAKEKLMEKFGFTEIQAQSVLDMKLSQLQKLNASKIDDEYNMLTEKIAEYRELLENEEKLLELIKEEIIAIAEKYGDDRLTSIEAAIDDVDYEDLIDEEEVIITLTNVGYVKRLTTDTYRSQRRGGKGVSALSTKEEDFVEKIITCSTHDHLLMFTNFGRLYKIKAYRIPAASRQAKGTPMINVIPLMNGEKVNNIIPVSEIDGEKFLTMITKRGLIKRTSVEAYSSNRKGGIYAISINEDDELMTVKMTDGNSQVLVVTRNGKSIRFKEDNIREMGRLAHGVRAIKLENEDYVVGACVVDENANLLVVTENGLGKITPVSEYKVQSRGGKGVKTYRITEKSGLVAGAAEIDAENDDLMMITSEGTIIRTAVSGISVMGRATQGVTLMKTAGEEKIVSIAITSKEEETEETEEINE